MSGSEDELMQHPLLMIPGPIEFHEDVLHKLSLPTLAHTDPQFINEFGETLEMLRQIFLTKTGQPFVLSGSGVLTWDIAVSNLMEKDDKALVITTGYFGDRFAQCFQTYGHTPTILRPSTVGDAPTLDELADTLKSKGPFKVVTITHVETSTGVKCDVHAFSKVIQQHSPGALIVVDGVCSIGGEELRMDEWGVDLAITASQKALGCPPGLAIVAASQRALKVIKERKTPIPNYYANLANWLPVMEAMEGRKPAYFATPAVNLVRALHTSAKQILQSGLEARFHQHAQTAARIRGALKALGLKLVTVRGDITSNLMTAIYLPEGVQATALLPKIREGGAVLAAGIHPDIRTLYFRFGHMGISSIEHGRGHIERSLTAIENALIECSVKGVSKGTAVA
eukprot:CAMPEP_0168565728 /NCGR_PEP_ID=MMETSP0413-20121227/14013_1 /TAXON_ID=136452 /ORGANISM="Filamoeba nolandi, Strain NC-AS-23-1" /LENGTH=396 /DNA_ID=CAMNT_0008597645 /DNA_START=1 /DNA_END=1188 /DNA_ORIENTATION=+